MKNGCQSVLLTKTVILQTRRGRALKAQLVRDLKAPGDPRIVGKGDIFDHDQYANPEHLHFFTNATNSVNAQKPDGSTLPI